MKFSRRAENIVAWITMIAALIAAASSAKLFMLFGQ